MTIVEVNPIDKLKIIYQNLLFSMEESQRDQLPSKDVVKKLITSFKLTIRWRVIQSIVQS